MGVKRESQNLGGIEQKLKKHAVNPKIGSVAYNKYMKSTAKINIL